MIYVPAVIAVGFYFERKRALATGIAVCGSGIGTFVFAPLITYLVEHVGWQSSLYVQSAIILTCVIFGILYRPLKPGRGSKKMNRKQSIQTPFPTPEGTPLLLRIKRARDMQKWDSVSSFVSTAEEVLTTSEMPDGAKAADAKARIYNKARRSSSHSLGVSTGGILIPGAFKKRKSVPLMASSVETASSVPNDATLPTPVTIPRINSTVRAKSFVAMPDLQEIAEEAEQNSDESSDNVSGSKKPDTMEESKKLGDEAHGMIILSYLSSDRKTKNAEEKNILPF